MVPTDLELVARAVRSFLRSIKEDQDRLYEVGRHSASNSLVIGFRLVTMRCAVAGIGAISILESMLQDTYDWQRPFEALNDHLRRHGLHEIADRFQDFRAAVNVLKHGRGRSYDGLQRQGRELAFRVKPPDEPCFEEGDVAEIATLVEVNPEFLRNCSEIIEEIVTALKEHPPE